MIPEASFSSATPYLFCEITSPKTQQNQSGTQEWENVLRGNIWEMKMKSASEIFSSKVTTVPCEVETIAVLNWKESFKNMEAEM